MDDFDLAFAPDPVQSQDSGQAAKTPDPGGDGGEGGTAPESQKADQSQDTTAQDGAQAKAPEEGKGVEDKELEPFKGLLESRKWNPKDPTFAPTVLKSYQEAEAYAKRRESENKLVQSARDAHAARLRGDVDSINQYRQSQGLPPIRVERPAEERFKEHEELVSSVNALLSNPNDQAALQKLDSMLTKTRENLLVERAKAAENKGPDAKQVFENRRASSSRNFGDIVSRNQEAGQHVDALSSYFEPGNLFDSLNIDIIDATQTPEQMAQLVELGQAVHVFKNLEKIVENRVNAEIERRRTATVASGTGKQPKTGASKSAASELSPVELAFLT